MACMSKRHIELVDGVGCCSAPMWSNSCPAGFCEEPAYGYQEPGQTVYGTWGPGFNSEGRWMPGGVFRPGYCGGLACPAHGGPKNKGEYNEKR